MNEIISISNQETFIIPTTPVYFTNWLGKHTILLNQEMFPSNKGWYVLQRSSPIKVVNNPEKVTISGLHVWDFIDDSGEKRSRTLPLSSQGSGVIEFYLTPLSNELTDLKAQCHLTEPSILEYFHKLLIEIDARFKEGDLNRKNGPNQTEKYIEDDEAELLTYNAHNSNKKLPESLDPTGLDAKDNGQLQSKSDKRKTQISRRGRRSEFSQDERDTAVKKWLNKSKNDARTLNVFLVDCFGEKQDNDLSDLSDLSIEPHPIVSRSAFYTWKKDYHKRNQDEELYNGH